MNTINAWLACDDDGDQYVFTRKPRDEHGIFFAVDGAFWKTSGHAINPGDCRPVKLKVEVVE